MSDEAANPVLLAIDKAVEEKTFSLDALKAIQAIKEQAEKLGKDLKYAQSNLERSKIDTERERSAKDRAEKTVQEWEKRESDLKARETKVTELEKQAAVAMAVSAAQLNMFGMVFANRTLRENIMETASKPVPNNTPGMYPTMMSESTNRTIDRTET